jgi:hypothetical protein
MKIICSIIVLGALLFTLGCATSLTPFSAIPLPPGAELANPEGPEEVPIDLTQGDMGDAVVDTIGRPRIEIYALPAETDWETVTQFYAEQLKSGDWKSEPRFSRQKGYYEMMGWTRGAGPNQQALLVAFLEKPEGASRNYLLVALAPEGS